MSKKEGEDEKVSLESENVEVKSEEVEVEGRKSEVNVKGEEGGGGGGVVVVMDTPERNKSQIATPISKFEESPFSNFLNNLSPIKPVKAAHFPQTLNTLSFGSIPSVFTSPHVSSARESRFLRRHLLSDPSKPEFASDNSVKVDNDEAMPDAVNSSNEPKESFGSQNSVVEASNECSKLAVERTLNYECNDSPSTLPTGSFRGKSLSEFAGSSVTYVPLVQGMSGKGLLRCEVNTEGKNELDPNKEAPGCDWENLICDATDLLIFDSPGDPEAFTKAAGPNLRHFGFASNEMQNMQVFGQASTSECGGDGSETEKPSTQPGDETQVNEYAENQNMKPDSSLTNDGMGVGQSERTDNEMVSTLYRGMRRRCLVFEMVGSRRKHVDEGSGSSAVQDTDGNLACNEKQLVPYKAVNESSRCILPGIGLHLNALAASSKDGKVVKHETNASGKQLLITSGSAVSLHPLVAGQESMSKSQPETSREIVPFENSVPLMEDASLAPGYVNNEELSQTSPKKKRRRLEPGEGEACKRCNCKKSKCLKLYCECFAAGVYCVEPCACQDCFNKPIHEDTVLATRKQIESRNPLAFAPKVIRNADTISETGDDSSKTPASARHKRGCNCKKSGCLKKYCECYQGGVGCSINCRCEGCKNAFGRKDGSIFIGTDGDAEEEETDAYEKSTVDRAFHKNLLHSDVELNPDSTVPATPLAFRRPPMQLPFSLKNKPPRSSFLAELSSSSSSSKTQLSNNASTDESIQNKVYRDSSYDFSNDAAMKRMRDNSKDFDFVTESPFSQPSPLSRVEESPNHGVLTPREVRVSFNENLAGNGSIRRRSNLSTGPGLQDEVVLSTSSSFRRKSNLLAATRTKSRLMDPPEQDQRSQKITMKSGILGRSTEFEDDDPFSDEDLPEEYKKMKFNLFSVLQMVSLILIIAAFVCSLTIRKFKGRSIFGLALWKWELMVLVLICGRLVSGWGIRLAVFFIERNFVLRKRVLYFVYGLRNSVQNCIWLSLVLIAWQCIFDKKVESITNTKVLRYVSQIWVCLLLGTFIWLLKTLLVKVLATSFHVTAFFDRIQEALFTQYVIETLSGPPLLEIKMELEEEERVIAEVQKLQSAGATLPPDLKASIFPKRPIGTPRKSTAAATPRSPVFSRAASRKEKEEQGGITIDHLHRLNQKNISAWNMKRLINIVRKGVLSTLDEKLEQSNGDDEAAVQITSEKQAKIAAKKVFINVAKPDSKFIYLEDIMRFMREDEALKTMQLFEGGTEAKGISKRALKNWVVNAFRERRALALSLNDTKTAVNKLHHMLNVLVGVIILVVWLLILKVATTHFLVFMSSQVLLVVFMFGNTAKTTFEAIIFLFVMHPFDVGDRVEIDGVHMIVEEMNILTTVLLRFDNLKITYPNSVLSTKPISNYYRSPDMGDAIEFCIHISTPMEKIASMKEKITRYIQNKSDHWYPDPSVVMRDVEDLNRIKWSVWISHTMNFQDMGERWARRALLIEEMVKIFRELDIEYRMLPLDVNVRNMPQISSSRVPSNWSLCA